MSRHLIGVTVTMEWPGLTVVAEPGFRDLPGQTPSQRQTELVYRSLCYARESHNAPDGMPDIRVQTSWAESFAEQERYP